MPKTKLENIVQKRRESQEEIAGMQARANAIMEQSNQALMARDDIASIQEQGNNMVEATAM